MRPDLIPCPCCGAPAHPVTVEYPDGREMYMVDCGNQECPERPFTVLFYTPEDAADSWNECTFVWREEHDADG